MQKYEAVNKLLSSEFRRLTGIQRTTFIDEVIEHLPRGRAYLSDQPQNVQVFWMYVNGWDL